MVVSIKSENSYRSDHSPVVLTCKTNEFIKGKGFWKFNTSLLLALLTLYCILLHHINSLTLMMFILFIEMYLGCIYDACIQMLYKRDTKGDEYAKLLNVPMYIHFSE